MTATLDANRQPAPSSPAAGRLLAVASGKGGVGKTWLSITLSRALVQAGRRVLLLDADLGLANVDIQLGLIPKHDLSSVLTGERTVAQCAAVYPPGGFAVLAGRSGCGALAGLEGDALDDRADRRCRGTRLRPGLAGPRRRAGPPGQADGRPGRHAAGRGDGGTDQPDGCLRPC